MGFILEHNCLLVLPDAQLQKLRLEIGSAFVVDKEGQRLYPINIPFEFCDKDYHYVGKVVVTKLIIEKSKTTLEGKILKIFSPEESKIFSDNFISYSEL